VGRSAVHAAKQLGARVVAGVRAKDKRNAESLGAAAIVAIDDDNEIASMDPLDGIADTVGGAVVAKLIPRLRKSGVLAAVVGRPEAPGRPDIRIVNVVVQSDPARLYRLAEDVLAGKLRIPIGKRLPLAGIQEAHRLAEKGGSGKILLVP
jgi:NADPH:quinone reductase-like Zn-dependent oxidoreductase